MTTNQLQFISQSEGILERRRLAVQGVVQGVGFRPFIYGLATELELAGFVGNDNSGVFIEIEGPPSVLAAFQEKLRIQAPPLAHIESISSQAVPVQGDETFIIVHSAAGTAASTLVSPDVAICDECLSEIFRVKDRRYRYPFTNCTNCGPRFTIVRDIPYDRPLTTMAIFPMCSACQAEYDDPRNRRFHAQPNACPTCGPRLEFQWSTAQERSRFDRPATLEADPLSLAQAVLAQGGIVAVKGLGGFHLACDATNDQALQTLRRRKGRVDKPFAIMVFDLETAGRLAEINDAEAALLTSRERPIVLLKKKSNSLLSPLIAPGNPYLGIMLPYTPLHYLLLAKDERSASPPAGVPDESTMTTLPPSQPFDFAQDKPPTLPPFQSAILVLTSGNFTDEPIVKDNDDALTRLAPLVDAFLLHNRDIQVHCDDSVIRVFEGRELPIRRSRGYAPFPVKLPFNVEPVLAAGGEIKSTFCLAKDGYAFMSQHIGDMENLETLQAFERAVEHMQKLFRIKPAIIACDLHPGYLSTRWAEATQRKEHPWLPENRQDEPTRDDLPISNLPISQSPTLPSSQSPNLPSSPILIKVQHHHAHLAAVMAENGLNGHQPVIGFSFDGTGYGPDGAIWGGELLIATYKSFERLAHLKYIPLPGGDAAIKRPYRAALAHLWAAGIPWEDWLPPVAVCPAVERKVIQRQLETGFNAVPASSMGRLFDAVAALAGVRQTVTYEAQAAIEFEALAHRNVLAGYQFEWALNTTGVIEIDPAPVLQAIVTDMQKKSSLPVISAKFHNAVAELVTRLSLHLRDREQLNQVALSGGVFQNITLLELTVNRLRRHGFEVLTHRQVPPNDGGLALGQAIIGGFQCV